MKQIILIKQSNSIQLAHLYEHIFCAQIDALFYDNGLFPHLDYKLRGRAFQRGIVYIDVQLYTNEAEALASRISTLEVLFNKDTISTAASQLIAEKEHAVDGQGYDAVRRTLEEAQPWQNLDSIDTVDTKGMRRKAQPLYIVEETSLPARKLTVNVSLGVDFVAAHRDLLPLFRQLALLISTTLQNVIMAKYGYYSYSDDYQESDSTVRIANVFKVPHGGEVNIKDTIATCKDVVDILHRRNSFGRLASELRQASLSGELNNLPSPECGFIDTGMIIGTEGWRRTATIKNCELILKNMSIEVKYARNTSPPLKGLLHSSSL